MYVEVKYLIMSTNNIWFTATLVILAIFFCLWKILIKYREISQNCYTYCGHILSIALSSKVRTFIRYPADCRSRFCSRRGRAYLASVLVDTALVLQHGRVIRALSLLRLSSLAPCQRARRLLSSCGVHRAMLPWHFPLRRTGAPKSERQPIAAVYEIPSMLRSVRENVRNILAKTSLLWENSQAPQFRNGKTWRMWSDNAECSLTSTFASDATRAWETRHSKREATRICVRVCKLILINDSHIFVWLDLSWLKTTWRKGIKAQRRKSTLEDAIFERHMRRNIDIFSYSSRCSKKYWKTRREAAHEKS